jgi:hypothetical protein
MRPTIRTVGMIFTDWGQSESKKATAGKKVENCS